MSKYRNVAHRLRREQNNKAARTWRARVKKERRRVHWVLTHPDLSEAEHAQARLFLSGRGAALSPKLRELLRLHLKAARAHARDRCGSLLSRLDALEVVSNESTSRD